MWPRFLLLDSARFLPILALFPGFLQIFSIGDTLGPRFTSIASAEPAYMFVRS